MDVLGAMIYLFTLRLAEYHRLKSVTPQCHYGTESNVMLMVKEVRYNGATPTFTPN